MHAETLAQPAKPVSHPQYMHVARWMVNYCNRSTHPRYDDIAGHLRRSQTRAGGPALRLAQALWDFHYRTLYPDDVHLEAAEENSFAHLYHHHMDGAKTQYHVWNAMQAFSNLRLRHYPDMLLYPTITQPDVHTPHPLRAALRHLDEKVLRAPARVGHHHLLKPVLRAISLCNPTEEDILLEVIEATDFYVDWRLDTTSSEMFIIFQKATNGVLNLRHRNRAYLENQHPQLELAITLLGRCLRNTPS